MTDNREKILLIICAVMVIIFPFVRFSLVIYQGYRGEGIINGKCVSYNILTGKLSARPFNEGCFNTGDYMLLIFCGLSPVCGLIYYLYARVQNPADELGKAWQKMNNSTDEYKNKSQAITLKQFQYKYELTKEIIREENQLKLMLEKDLIHNW